MGITARTSRRPHIDYHLDFGFTQQGPELGDRAGRVADGEYGPEWRSGEREAHGWLTTTESISIRTSFSDGTSSHQRAGCAHAVCGACLDLPGCTAIHGLRGARCRIAP